MDYRGYEINEYHEDRQNYYQLKLKLAKRGSPGQIIRDDQCRFNLLKTEAAIAYGASRGRVNKL